VPKNLLAHLALLAVNLIYGSSHFIAKIVMPDYLKPNTFILLRIFGATLMFWSLRFFIREKVENKDLIKIAIAGFFGVALNQLLFFQGLSITSPIDSAIIMVTSPVIVTLLSFFILKTKLTSNKVIGISSGLIGAILLIYLSSNGNTDSSILGNLFILGNATSYSLYLVLVKPLLNKYKPLTVISYMFLFAFFIVLPFGIQDLDDFSWDFPPTVLLAIGFIILFTTFCTYLFNIFAVKQLSPTIASSYIYLQPVFAMLIGFFIALGDSNSNHFGEITWQKIGCTFLIFTGVFLTSRTKKAIN
jgi:drug/metabolite transporter (DMT)-like permease|tara:strand:+ start:3406 stop:4311 length:906 start_codon:yes stop_codon:yes gene_type:complete